MRATVHSGTVTLQNTAGGKGFDTVWKGKERRSQMYLRFALTAGIPMINDNGPILIQVTQKHLLYLFHKLGKDPPFSLLLQVEKQ